MGQVVALYAPADQARLELEQRALAQDAKRESDQLQRKLKEKDAELKKLRKADLLVKQTQVGLYKLNAVDP